MSEAMVDIILYIPLLLFLDALLTLEGKIRIGPELLERDKCQSLLSKQFKRKINITSLAAELRVLLFMASAKDRVELRQQACFLNAV